MPLPSSELEIVHNPEIESTRPEKLPKRKSLIFKHYKDIIAALGYVGGSVYLAFKHKELLDGAIVSSAYLVATVATVFALEERRIDKEPLT